jgi:hypothetical protein
MLDDGKSVEILSAGPLRSTQGWSALMLKYRTSIPVTDVTGLRREVDQIWERVVADVERGGYKTAVISANEPETGLIIHTSRSYSFVFERQGSTWHMLDPK